MRDVLLRLAKNKKVQAAIVALVLAVSAELGFDLVGLFH